MTPPTPQITPGELALPRPPGVFRRWMSEHPRAVDWIIVGTYLFGCVLMMFVEIVATASVQFIEEVDPEAANELGVGGVTLLTPWVLVVLGCVALVAVALRFRRKYPLAGVILVGLVLWINVGFVMVPNSIALVFLLYAVPLYRGVREAWIAYGCATLLGAVDVYFGNVMGLIGPSGLQLIEGSWRDADRISAAILNALWLLTIVLIGINIGNRKRYVQALIDRAHQLVTEREQRAQLAAAEERARIAREMHDIIAHSLSVVVTLTEAASVSIDRQPAAAKTAMERAAETGRQSLHEMRRLLGILNRAEPGEGERGASQTRSDVSSTTRSSPRDGIAQYTATSSGDQRGTNAEPQPDLTRLGELVAGFRDAGLRLTVTEQGTAQGDASHQLAVYRITQEALTNTLRYAGSGAKVSVTLIHDETATLLTVIDEGPAAGVGEREGRSQLAGSGNGLAGAAERARIFGGWLEAGPLGPGWKVRASLPTDRHLLPTDQRRQERK